MRLKGRNPSSKRHRLPRRGAALRVLLLVAAVACAGVDPQPASAGEYTVLACEAAGPAYGWAADGWAPAYTHGAAYVSCPTGGNSVKGISNRIVNQTTPRDGFNLYFFNSAPRTSIRLFRWAGRMARNNCDWSVTLLANPGNWLMTGLPAHGYCNIDDFDTRSTAYDFVPPPGTTTVAQVVQCKAISYCASGAALHTNFATVTVVDNENPVIEAISGPLADGAWVRGQQVINSRVSDNSGIDRVSAEVPGAQPALISYPCSPASAKNCPTTPATGPLNLQAGSSPDGEHTLRVHVIDAAGNSSEATRTARIDNTPPDPVRPSVFGGDAWRRSDSFELRWTKGAETYAPIARVHWEICSPNGNCELDSREGDESTLPISVPAAGDHTVRAWLEDAAGNQHRPPDGDVVHLRHDPVPPELAFEPADAADPLKVTVAVHDQHSGLASGEIELRRLGGDTWHPMDTGVSGSSLVAHVDDERFRNGSYEFRARARDGAGNEASTASRIDGSAATLRLPVRIATRLRVGVARYVVRRRFVRRHRRRRLLRRRQLVLAPQATVRQGKRVKIRGRLANPDGQPLDGATISVFEAGGVGALLPIGLAHANDEGWFAYTATARHSRVLRFLFRGSPRIHSATRDVALKVPASSSISSSRSAVLNGETVRFIGRVESRPVPRDGKLIEVQAFFRGRWRTFSTVRSDRRGRWSFPYRFGGTVGRVAYRFRVLLPREGGYPFDTGSSRTVVVTVRGL